MYGTLNMYSYAQLVKMLIAFEISAFWWAFLGVVSRVWRTLPTIGFSWRTPVTRHDTALTPLTLRYTGNDVTDVRGPRSQFYIELWWGWKNRGEQFGRRVNSEASSKISFGYTSFRVYRVCTLSINNLIGCKPESLQLGQASFLSHL
jgi:hypothetical protein